MPHDYVFLVLYGDEIVAVYANAQTATQHAERDRLEVQRWAVLTKLRPY